MSRPSLTHRQEVAFDGPQNYCDTACFSRAQGYYDSAEACVRDCVAHNQNVGPTLGQSTPAQLACQDRCLTLPATNGAAAIVRCREACLAGQV